MVSLVMLQTPGNACTLFITFCCIQQAGNLQSYGMQAQMTAACLNESKYILTGWVELLKVPPNATILDFKAFSSLKFSYLGVLFCWLYIYYIYTAHKK